MNSVNQMRDVRRHSDIGVSLSKEMDDLARQIQLQRSSTTTNFSENMGL